LGEARDGCSEIMIVNAASADRLSGEEGLIFSVQTEPHLDRDGTADCHRWKPQVTDVGTEDFDIAPTGLVTVRFSNLSTEASLPRLG
jgi:hypothetical protein